MHSFGWRRKLRLDQDQDQDHDQDHDHVSGLGAATNYMTMPASVRFQSGPVARHGDRWPAAMGSRRHSSA